MSNDTEGIDCYHEDDTIKREVEREKGRTTHQSCSTRLPMMRYSADGAILGGNGLSLYNAVRQSETVKQQLLQLLLLLTCCGCSAAGQGSSSLLKQ